MALITSHLLNGTDGTHAAGVSATLRNCATGAEIFKTQTSNKGRMEQQVGGEKIDPDAPHELVFDTTAYWQARGISGPDLIYEIVLRFRMPDPDGHYHSPVILSPNSCSIWKSSREASNQ